MKKILSLSLLFSLLLSLFSCSLGNRDDDGARTKTVSTTYFHTVSLIYTFGDEDGTKIEKYAAISDECLSYYHKLFDIYFEYAGINNIKTINKKAGKEAVTVDRELVDFLLYCKELFTLTNGKTNIMLGSVLEIWHDAREDATEDFGYLSPSRLPRAEELADAATHTSIDSLIIDEEACTVYISDPDASIDVGAIAKGYTVDMLTQRLVDEGADSVVLNIGGSLRTIGLKPDGTPWVTGIKDPSGDASDSLKCRIEIGDGAVVTSGDYERYFISGDKKYHHIIDPVTLMPADYFSAVTILTKDSGLADALSTALFCMSYDEGLALIEGLSDVDAIWIFKDGRMESTDGVRIL